MLKQCVFGIVFKEGEIETDQIYKITYVEGDIADQIKKKGNYKRRNSIEGEIVERDRRYRSYKNFQYLPLSPCL